MECQLKFSFCLCGDDLWCTQRICTDVEEGQEVDCYAFKGEHAYAVIFRIMISAMTFP